jgi:hypothetical protein
MLHAVHSLVLVTTPLLAKKRTDLDNTPKPAAALAKLQRCTHAAMHILYNQGY